MQVDRTTGTQDTELEVLREIARAIRSIKYGQIQVTVHDQRVVEIATTEKRRL
jgi:hypothetical protein